MQYFPTILNEVLIYGHPDFQGQESILRLEGVSWEVSKTGNLTPNLVFEKSTLGNCEAFFGGDNGQRLTLEEKIDLCLQLAKAIALIHHADIIHGDIKPQNILVFLNENSKYLVKLSDFGYSSFVLVAERDRLVYMPKSVPWNAPEHHYRGFKFDDAVKMDIFSFGAFCLWLLFKVPHKDWGPMIKRSSMMQISGTLKYDVLGKEAENNCFTLQVMQAVPQLFNADFEVRQGIFKCFESLANLANENTSSIQPVTFNSDLKYQLACCYKIGFGVPRDDEKCQHLLRGMERKLSDLEDHVNYIKSSTSQGYSPTSSFRFWSSKFPVLIAGDAQYYRERGKLKDIQHIEKRELKDWKETFGVDHWLVLTKEVSYFRLLSSLGYLNKAAALAERRCKDLSLILPAEDNRVLEARHLFAEALLNQRRHSEAEREILAVMKVSNSTGYAHAVHRNLLANVHSDRGNYKRSIALREEIHKELVGSLGESNIQTLNILWNLQDDYYNTRNFEKAEELTQTLIDIATKAHGTHHEVTIRASAQLVLIHWSMRSRLWGHLGSRKQSEINLPFIKECQRVLGEEHPITLSLMFHSSRSLAYKTQFDDAIVVGQRVVDLTSRTHGPEHPFTLERKKWLLFLRRTHWYYKFFNRLGTVYIGQYSISPAFNTKHGWKRLWGPICKRSEKPPLEIVAADIDSTESTRVAQE